MNKLNAQKLQTYVLVFILLIGAILRFYNLDWGQGYFFHPDENNIASLALSLDKNQTNFWTQGTFSYGTSLTYLSFFIRKGIQQTSLCTADFPCQILILRSLSALFSVLTIYFSYLTAKFLFNKKAGFLVLVLVAFSPGLIQSAHFGTFESALTLLYLIIFYLSLKIIRSGNLIYVFFTSVFIAISGSLKINSLLLLPIPTLSLFLHLFVPKWSKSAFKIKGLFLSIAISLITFPIIILLSPYYLTQNFHNMFAYERGVVSGSLDVFYTRQFFGTDPLFPLTHILPYITNPFLIVFCLFFLVLAIFRPCKEKTLLALFILILFLPNALFFTKWTRYFIPLIPFLALTVPFVYKSATKINNLMRVILTLTILLSIFQGIAFFSIYWRSDSRITASRWISQNIPSSETILNETGNVVDIPFEAQKMIVFDFYNLDFNPALKGQLLSDLEKSEYILIPSRRLFMDMGRFPNKYPLLSKYYQLLFNGNLGFHQIKELHSYPSFEANGLGIEFPDERAEETWTVFDHPVIRVFKKTKQLTQGEYNRLLEN
ncbi:MAG: glycosyltransferase family 39 protein [Candidatus Daviesbacteria bacterium]